jgi:hypothetical protein
MSRSTPATNRVSTQPCRHGGTARSPSSIPRAQRALAHEVAQLRRGIGEGDGCRLVVDAVAALHEAPCHDDVLADGVGPTSDAADDLVR